MRIACLHLPQFALQCATRVDPSLRGAAVAITGLSSAAVRAGAHGPVVQACSKAAWALGCRVGMTATAARALSPDLCVVNADPQVERETMRALADVLSAVTPEVELGTRVGAGGAHLAMYCEVPAKTRGTSFGDKVVTLLEQLGMTVRVGIADDRFTAWVAASERTRDQVDGDPEADVVSVPRGGSAAYLAPRPLALLAIGPEVQHMLEALGVSTLGEFSALPAPSVVRPFEADFQALARGESGHTIKAYSAEAPIREESTVGTALTAAAAVAVIAERIALRLAGRSRGAARLEVGITGADGVMRMREVDARLVKHALFDADLLDGAAAAGTDALVVSAESIAENLTRAIGSDLHTAVRLRVTVTGESVAGDAAAAAATAAMLEQARMSVLRAAEPPASGREDVLGVVLSTTGSTLRELPFGTYGAGSSVRAEHRATHHRTQRGKQRRRDRTAESLAQPRLFK